jgi:XPA protein C-terminus
MTLNTITLLQGKFSSQMKARLDTLPFDVLREMVTHLDVGLIISLSQVNQALRAFLINDDNLWLSRLQRGLKVSITRKRKQDPFGEVVKRIRTHRCADCRRMEVSSQRPFMDAFFNKLLCIECRKAPKYRVITTLTAKKNYFLTDDDLLPLRTISAENPHHKDAGHIRLYSRVSVQDVSEAKLEAIGITREERKRKQRERGEKIKQSKLNAKERRRTTLSKELTAHGFSYSEDCPVADAFINGARRINLEEVTEHFREKH